MKKILRLTALLLALVMCLGMTALAAEITETDTATITGQNGATATFTDTTGEKVSVTYTDTTNIADGELYLVLVVKGEQTSFEINEGTILYIDQVTGSNGSISFTVYPSDVQDSVILIYGTDVDTTGTDNTPDELIAAIIKAKYILGDVNGDGEVKIGDATQLLKHFAGLTTDSDVVNLAAADANRDGEVKIGDVTTLLQLFAGIISAL